MSRKLRLSNSPDSVHAQFKRNETRLLRNPELKSRYDKVISEYIKLGHMPEVPFCSSEMNSYYLTHYAVFQHDGTTTTLCIVFNASSPSSNDVSLNYAWYPWHVLQADFTDFML